MRHSTPADSPRRPTRSRAKAPLIDITKPGRLRVGNVIALLNISAATFYAGMKVGRYPPPDGRDGHFPFWQTATILGFIEAH